MVWFYTPRRAWGLAIGVLWTYQAIQVAQATYPLDNPLAFIKNKGYLF